MNPNPAAYTAVVIVGESIAVTVEGKTTTIAHDAPNYHELYEAVKTQQPTAKIKTLLTPLQVIKTMVKEAGFEIKIDENTQAPSLFLNGTEVNSKVSKMILAHYNAGEDFKHLKNFMLKAEASKSLGKIDVLYDFIDKNKLPIHPDGDFFAFKAVRSDGRDQHSGTVLYQIGKYIEAPDFDPSEYTQCGRGLHIGGRQYVRTFGNHGSRYFVVKVDPSDAIFFTGDEGKMRVRKMFVYGETIGGDELLNSLAFNTVMSPEGDLLQAAAEQRILKKAEAKSPRKRLEWKPVPPAVIEAAEKAGAAIEAGSVTVEAPVPTKPKKKLTAEEAAANRKATKKARKKIARAKKAQTFVGRVKTTSRVSILTFTNKANLSFTDKQILDGVAEHGQRGFARVSGLSKSTIQEWLKVIAGEPARVR